MKRWKADAEMKASMVKSERRNPDDDASFIGSRRCLTFLASALLSILPASHKPPIQAPTGRTTQRATVACNKRCEIDRTNFLFRSYRLTAREWR